MNSGKSFWKGEVCVLLAKRGKGQQLWEGQEGSEGLCASKAVVQRCAVAAGWRNPLQLPAVGDLCNGPAHWRGTAM